MGEQGSPPRVRELRPRIILVDQDRGITPACAGITEVSTLQQQRKQDHPRVCGNYH